MEKGPRAPPAAPRVPALLARIVEIQKADAVRFYGAQDVGQRLLDQTCPIRTGRHEEDGCWPNWGYPPTGGD